MREYVIWGKDNEKAEVARLYPPHLIKSMEHAVKIMEQLKALGCTDMRVQVIDFSD